MLVSGWCKGEKARAWCRKTLTFLSLNHNPIRALPLQLASLEALEIFQAPLPPLVHLYTSFTHAADSNASTCPLNAGTKLMLNLD